MSASADGEFCAYCGLPVSPGWWRQTRSTSAESSSNRATFCCFGCRFASAVVASRGEVGALNWTLTRIGLAIFFTLNVMAFSMALWTQDWSHSDAAAPLARSLFELFRYVCLLFALPVLLLLGGPILADAWQSLREGRFTIALLIVLGVGASYLVSAVSVARGSGPVYFEVGCMVLVLVTLGQWLDAVGKHQATQAIEALEKLVPEKVRLLREGDETWVPRSEVRGGDWIRVLPGERIPCDASVRRGTTTVDEQLLTGESVPLVKGPGDAVWGGTLNLEGELVVAVTQSAAEGAWDRLVALVREARRQKGHYERLADRVVRYFLPGVALVAVVTVVLHANRSGVHQGVLAGLSVLLIACPCALGIATPLAVWSSLGRAARAGALFRNGGALERLALVRAVRFDKTGPLTDAAPTVTKFEHESQELPERLLARAGRLAAASTHAISLAISSYVNETLHEDEPIFDGDFDQVRSVAGRGVKASGGPRGESVALGNARFMQQLALRVPGELQPVLAQAGDLAQPLACIGWGGRVRGVFLFEERLRPEATAAVAQLKSMGLDVAVLTGDHAARGAAVARELAVPVEAELLPEDKVDRVRRAQRTHGLVAMVGDGVNDAPALAASDVGVALGCGADVSRDVADLCLLGNNVLQLPWCIDLARRTRRVIRQNLFWAFAYNVVGIALAAGGMLNPILAALAMVLSSAMVVANSWRLAREDNPISRDNEKKADPTHEVMRNRGVMQGAV